MEAMIDVPGSPVGGENPPHDKQWRMTVAAAASGVGLKSAAALHFRSEAGRKVDLDNLVRPALAGLRDAGVFTYGFRNLEALWATKAVSERPGLTIELDRAVARGHVPQPGPRVLVVAHGQIPRDGDRQSKLAWRDTVDRSHTGDVMDADVWLDVAVRTHYSLEGLLKPIIDGLEPLLGRDPGASREFTPNDDRVVWLRISRQLNLASALVLAAGPLEGAPRGT